MSRILQHLTTKLRQIVSRRRDLAIDQDEGPPPGVTVEQEDGKTVVYRRHHTSDSGVVVIKQSFDSAVQHHYSPGAIGEDFPLYAGIFRFRDADSASGAVEGDIRFSWNPTPRVLARGGASIDTSSRLADIFAESTEPKWRRMGDVVVDTTSGVPSAPAYSNISWDKDRWNSWFEDRIATLDVGVGDRLEVLTFFMPNGWQCLDGIRVQDPDEPWVWWDGRVTADGAGWSVVLDPIGPKSSDYWKTLKASGTSDMTHVGRLTRADNSEFSATDAKLPQNAIRLALSFALGRAVQCTLPVGWRGNTPVWTMWHTGNVDRMRVVHSLLDQSESAAQVRELIKCTLDFSQDPIQEEVLQYAVSYYITANYDVNVEVAVSLAVSALQMIAYYRFVEVRSTYSRGDWDAKSTGDQIRLLLNDCSIDLDIPDQFTHLESVRSTLGPMPDGSGRDALHCIIKMRNNIVHPTRDRPARWDPYQWSEASQLALDFLRFAILNQIGYNGNIRTAAQPSKYAGSVTRVPWAP